MPQSEEIFDNEVGQNPEAVAKLTRIFEFLSEFAKIQNPVTKTIPRDMFSRLLGQVPQHPYIVVPFRQGRSAEDDFVLKVRRPDRTPPPPIPALLLEWVLRSDNPAVEPTRVPSKNVESAEGTLTVLFDDDIERGETWNEWLPTWQAWAEAEKPNRIATHFFNEIYALNERLVRESETYELMLGDGMLICSEVGIRHPAISQKLSIEFAPDVPEFTISALDDCAELDVALLWELPGKRADQILACKRQLAEEASVPSDPDGLRPFLGRLIQGVVANGEFFDEPPDANAPSIYMFSAPVVYMRKRSGGFSDAIDRIIAQIPNLTSLPPALVQICGIGNPVLEDEEEYVSETANHYGNERSDILFTKPANEEQVQIVDRLKRHGTVIVQGPPGTGKSYTIGNIIGHLLAQGQRILVTAHTTKALSVVRDQVVEGLRSLCVSVLENDAAGKEELAKAVATISERLSRDDARQLRRDADRLSAERTRLLADLKAARAKSCLVRSAEYREVTFDGLAFSPSEAARLVKAGEGVHDWLPRPIASGLALPISESDIARLYATNAELTTEDEAELKAESPPAASLPEPSRFAELVAVTENAEALDISAGAEHWTRAPVDADYRGLQQILLMCENAPQQLDADTWRFTIVAESMASSQQRQKWLDVVSHIRHVAAEADGMSRAMVDFGPEVPETIEIPHEECLQHLREIRDHIVKKGRIQSFTLLLKPRWKQLLGSCRVNGRAPTVDKEFDAILGLMRVRESRRMLKLRWQRTLEPLGAHTVAELGDEPERILVQYVPELESLINWSESTFQPLHAQLAATGFEWNNFFATIPPEYSELGQLLRIKAAVCNLMPAIVQARINLLQSQTARDEMAAATKAIQNTVSLGNASHVTHALSDAVSSRNVERFSECHERLIDLQQKRSVFAARTELLERLHEFAPGWAEAIRRRAPEHDSASCPGGIKEAWKWRQLHDELEKRATETPESIDEQIEQMSARLFEKTADLADRLAWAHQLESVERNQTARMALIGWQQTYARIGRTARGPRAAELREAARKEMQQAKDAVPVWIMPLKKVLENFDPVKAQFDVIVIDEASQCDVMGLVPLFMAKTVIVVGDHEQVSPEGVGMRQNDVDRIVQTHLQGIPQSHLYDGKASIYQFAQRSFSGSIMLREHFRCDSKIISFSNRLCYGGKIVPLRDTSTVATRPPVVPYKVEGAAVSKVNEVEAEAVVSLIAACLERPEYQSHPDGKPVTYGVISLVGTEQAERIRVLLSQRLSLATIERHRIICGNAAQFQGDERDVIFLTMVDSPEGNGPLSMRQAEMFVKRFNVACSRARNQQWLIYSADPAIDLQGGDLRRRIIEHCLNPDAMEDVILEAEARTESEFERRVVRRLVGESYKVVPQWKVGKFRIDLVVEGAKSRLAVELDGDRWHPPEQLEADFERQAMLERAGWKFVRIRGSQFFRNEDRALAPLYEKLDRLDIRPIIESAQSVAVADEHIDAIKLRAQEFRQQWRQEDGGGVVEEFIQETQDIPDVELPAPSEPSTRSEGASNGVLQRPFTVSRIAAHANVPIKMVQDAAWREALYAADGDDSSIPLKVAKLVAARLEIAIED